MESLEGTVHRIIFRNENNNYTVVLLQGGDIACGILPPLSEGDILKCTGSWVKHPKYGLQFQVNTVDQSSDITNRDIVSFLGSGIIKGIKHETAKNIVKEFGDKVFNIFENRPNELLKIKGIGQRKLQGIIESWENISHEIEPLFFLMDLGLSLPLAKKVYATYQDSTIDIIKSNPYRMIGDIWGIGFERADKIARALGIRENDKQRVKAWIVYYLSENAQNGNTFIHFGSLFQHCERTLGYQLAEDDVVLHELHDEGEIIFKNGNIYLSELYYMERAIEQRVRYYANRRTTFDPYLLPESHELSEEQLEAVSGAFTNGMSIITGGPGTGKTTSIKSIYNSCKKFNLICALAAPTGRAAKRISQVIGAEAKTIHRLLEYNPVDNSFFYNEDNPLEIDVLIVDEISMVDTYLFYRLLLALGPETRLILLGDGDQLPAIGPGEVMKDLINSGIVAVYEFNKIYRQSEGSGIVELAALIRDNAEIDLNKEFEGVEFIATNNNSEIPDLLLSKIHSLVYDNNLDPIFDLQVISPVYKGETGVDKLNQFIQDMLNKSGDKIHLGNNRFRIHDKVMQLRNNYTKNIFNGDIGIIQHFDSERNIINILFENRMVEFGEEELDELRLAYAATVHKCQGSEYNTVILVINPANAFMFTKNLIYTAITRAKNNLIILGSPEAFIKGTRNLREAKRLTSLFKVIN